jgi:NADPH-dependent 2,4-dienoyl-CoA reductase/sulfur reductase-like enzyme/rhodanese-related sulfurtransferase
MTTSSLTIVIVGGVAGGASAATRARRMNEQAEIILFEKNEHVSFANCGLPYHIGEEIPERGALLVATPEFLAKRFRIDVRVQQEVLSIDRARNVVTVRITSNNGETDSYEQSYDKLILAPGASPLVPPLEGVNAPNVLTLRNLRDTDRIKAIVDRDATKRAFVIGAGFIGLEMVEQLVRRDVATTLVELQTQVLPLLDAEMAKPIERELLRHDVTLHLGIGLERIILDENGTAVAAELANGTRVETDLVILGIGVRPNISLAKDAGLEIGASGGIATNDYMQTSDDDIYAVGDAAEYPYTPANSRMRIALAGPANRAGRLAGEHAAIGHSEKMQGVLGTSVVRVFDVSAAMTGLTSRLAGRMKRDSRSVTIITKHHAGYFPGAEMMTLKLLYSPDDGTIMGTQIVGGSGVDKRVDVIATAMHFNGTVRDLAGVDLAYAPPFGSAKDPVHLAAFVACNQLDGIETLTDADADLDGKQVVDVRTTVEVERAPLKGVDSVVHIPVDELRDRLDELDPAKDTVVSCAVGIRGHIASRILKKNGFNVSNLSGGATVRNRVFD